MTSHSGSVDQSLRGSLANLEAAGLVSHVTFPIHWRFEAAAVLWELGRGPAVVMENIVDYPGASIVGNIITSQAKLAAVMGWPADEVESRVASVPDRLIAPTIVGSGAVQEIVRTSDIDLFRDFPIPVVSELDGGRYISCGVVVTRDPIRGRRNACIQRIQVQGPDRLGIFMAATHNRSFLQTYREQKRRMPVAIAIGNHAAVVLGSQFTMSGDEFDAVGALLDEPVRLVRCRTVDLEVPAEAEIVLEGYIDPEEEEMEGPFGELLGLYSHRLPSPVIHLTAVTTRRQPMFQMICASSHPEHLWTGGIVQEAMLFNAVKAAVPSVRAVEMPEGGFCRYHAVISLAKQSDDDPWRAIDAALEFSDRLKHIVVVDEDVDPADPTKVQQAMVAWMRADRDLVVRKSPTIHHMDPTMEDGLIARVLIDATEPLKSPTRGQARAFPPAAVAAAVAEWWRRPAISAGSL